MVVELRTKDVYSLVSFNFQFKIQFALLPAHAAAVLLQQVWMEPKSQTSYSSGLDGIRECVPWIAAVCRKQFGRGRTIPSGRF